MFNLITIPSLPMDLLPTSYHTITYLLPTTYICIYLPMWLKLYIFHVVIHIWIVNVCSFEKYNMKFQELWKRNGKELQENKQNPTLCIRYTLETLYLIGTWVQIHFFPPKPFAFKVCSFELWWNFQV